MEFDALPPNLRDPARDAWRRIASALAPDDRDAVIDAEAASIPTVLACSRFVGDACARDPVVLVDLVRSGRLERGTAPGEYRALIADAVPPDAGDRATMQALRQFRRREMLRIAWRDLAGSATVDETLGELSDLADAAVVHAVEIARRELTLRHGLPRRRDGSQVDPIVLAMGKLGGRELNFSSDIDLVFLFPVCADTDGPRPLDPTRYFRRLGQRLIRLLDETTADGFVFRVDVRLRPFGTTGALALSVDAFEAYLVEHGREWERYAYVKARAICGNPDDVASVSALIRPFVYRRYLDFGIFESLREMKAMIRSEVTRRELKDDIKLGSGGIREIEFIAQVLQMIRGGRDAALRSRSLLGVIGRLAERRFLDPEVAEELLSAYRFLRRLENRIQALDDKQTHRLPDDVDDRARLALAMGFDDWPTLAGSVADVRACVATHFDAAVLGPAGDASPAPPDVMRAVWDGTTGDPGAVLKESGYRDPGRVLAVLDRLRAGTQIRRLDERGRARFDILIPRLLAEAAALKRAEDALERVATIIDAVGLRSAYFALLNERPVVLGRLLDLCARSRLIAGQVARDPLLLDALIDPAIFTDPPTRAQFETDLARRFEDLGDAERQREALSQFQRNAVFQVAVADLSGALPLMKVSDRLTDIAELVLERALAMARGELQAVHGKPVCGDGRDRREAGFAIVAYGKLGGLELGYGSDLDIVFLHDSAGENQQTDGSRPLDNGRFFARVAQRIVSMLTTQTGAGAMYEVDTRLRPSGKSGLLVSAVQAFENYQREEAWTWEHQALLRARAVAGDRDVMAAFETVRRRILVQPRDDDALRDAVRTMRERMRRELGGGGPRLFHIKRDPGGITDIEFLVQFQVLRHAYAFPALVTWSDNIRQLEALADAALIETAVAKRLASIYRAYRRRLHRRNLMGDDPLVRAGEFDAERETVVAEWRAVFGTNAGEDVSGGSIPD